MSTRQAVLASTDYEPYDNRTRPHLTGSVASLAHLVKAILGTGILAMPQAYKNAGFVVGAVGSVLITLLVTFCIHLLYQGMYFVCKRDKIPQITYPQVLKEVLKIGPVCLRKFSDSAPCIVNSFIIVYQIGVMGVYLAFCGTNLKQVVDHYTPTARHFSTEVYEIFFLVPFILLSFVPNLKKLAPFSQVANGVTFVALVALYYYFFERIEPFSERSLFAHIKTYPLFMGTNIFCLLSMGGILSIELNMRNGRHWTTVLNTGMVIVSVLNFFTGFFGYWRYGDDVMPVITLNIDINQILAQIIRIAFVFAIFISYSLKSYPVTEIIWEQYAEEHMKTTQHPLIWNYSIRASLVFSSLLLAIYVPELGLVISFIGAFCLSVLGIMLPALIDVCSRWPDDFGKGKMILVRDIFIILFGFLAWTFGTYSSVRGIIERYVEK